MRPVVVLFLGAILVAVILLRLHEQSRLSASEREAQTAECSQVLSAFRAHRSGIWLGMSGRVARLLADSDGTRVHQRFIVGCAQGQTVLIVNDVSIGQRAPVHPGDTVAVRGQYVWNTHGGLIHFTHQANGGAESGWILLNGRLYSLGAAPLT